MDDDALVAEYRLKKIIRKVLKRRLSKKAFRALNNYINEIVNDIINEILKELEQTKKEGIITYEDIKRAFEQVRKLL